MVGAFTRSCRPCHTSSGRLARGVVGPQLQPMDVGELVRRVASDQDLVGGSSLRVEVHPVVVPVDPPKVERIVENLIANAPQTHAGGHADLGDGLPRGRWRGDHGGGRRIGRPRGGARGHLQALPTGTRRARSFSRDGAWGLLWLPLRRAPRRAGLAGGPPGRRGPLQGVSARPAGRSKRRSGPIAGTRLFLRSRPRVAEKRASRELPAYTMDARTPTTRPLKVLDDRIRGRREER